MSTAEHREASGEVVPVRQRVVQRILQLDGRRYSISLEPIFWRVLGELAEATGIRLNVLVANVARTEAADGGGNLTSRLRVYCAEELRSKLLGAALAMVPANVIAIAEVSPAPCFVISAEQEIIAANESFGNWFGAEIRTVVGQPLSRYFRLNTRPSFAEIWAEFQEGRLATQAARLVSIAPGRVRAANVVLQPLPVVEPLRFCCLSWLRL
jgi:predicted DNA-binding ribbon-helix-helix protein